MKLPKMAAVLLAAVLVTGIALPALAADQRAELELEASVRCTGEAADETLTVRLTALDGAPLPEGCEEEAELDFPARDCSSADNRTLTKAFSPIVYTVPGVYEYIVTQDTGGRRRADYDDTVFRLKVTAAWDTDGRFKVSQAVRREEADTEKTDLLFKNSYRGADPMPAQVTPPAVTDKPAPRPAVPPTQATAAEPEPVTVTPPAEATETVVILPPAKTGAPVTTLIQTGQLFWPVPVLTGCGLGLLAVGVWLSRRHKPDA